MHWRRCPCRVMSRLCSYTVAPSEQPMNYLNPHVVVFWPCVPVEEQSQQEDDHVIVAVILARRLKIK